MKNYVGSGHTVQFTAGSAISSGDVVVLGTATVGIAANDVASGAVGVAVIEGEFRVDKITGTAWAVGDILDYDVSAGDFGKAITPTTGDMENCAVCTEAAADSAATGKVRLLPGNGTLN